MDVKPVPPHRENTSVCLTDDDQDEEEGGHAGRDVEHVADVPGQLVHVLHVGNQDGREQETDGDAQLENRNNNNKQPQG